MKQSRDDDDFRSAETVMAMKVLVPVFFFCWLLRPPEAAAKSLFDHIFSPKSSATPQAGNPQTVASALTEALQNGIRQAVSAAGRENGFYANPEIRIAFPSKLAAAEKALRKVGLGGRIEKFELGMNRAAEKAAPLAKDVLLRSLAGLSFRDAKEILNGGETAATDYFRKETYDTLLALFKPQVAQAMQEFDLTRQFNRLVEVYSKIPLAAKPQALKVEDYVAAETLDGLFFLVAREESRIRKDPAARASELLKTVFSKTS